MRGLSAGEQSDLDHPRLQFFARSEGFLTDIYSGSYIIQDIRDSSSSPTTKVADTALSSSDKLGTGRYALSTGDTSSWDVGTHRAVVTYKMEDGGPDFVQSIEFEVLDSGDWPVSASYTGYLSTRQAYQDSYASSSDTTRQSLHRYIAEISQAIERWTGRWFDPRYLHLKVAGKKASTLLLDAPIVAIEDVYAVWQTTTGEDTYKFEQYLYKVYNRHLNSSFEIDDRKNPHIKLTNVTGTIVRVSGYAWPYGNQNIKVQGIFGYTDPDADPTTDKVSIGHTPYELARAVGALLYRRISDPTMSNPLTWSPGSVRSMRTRHQSVSFGGSGSGSGSGTGASELSGDPFVDAILVRFCKPPAFGGV